MSPLLWRILVLAPISTTFFSTLAGAAQIACPLLGPDYPKPTQLSSCPSLPDVRDTVTSLLDKAFETKKFKSSAIAVQAFSACSAESKPLFEYYQAGNKALNTSAGVSQIDGDTVFPVASISKLFTVYSHLVQDGDLHFNFAVTDYVPELKQLSHQAFNGIDFEDITVGALASQLSGLTRDLGAAEVPGTQSQLIERGLPPLSKQDANVCGPQPTQRPCSRQGMVLRDCLKAHLLFVADNGLTCQEFLKHLSQKDPVYQPSSNAIYSNVNYIILSYVTEAIAGTGQKYADILRENVIEPFGLKGTSTTNPDMKRGAISNTSEGFATFNHPLGFYIPGGGIYSTADDLTALGRSILSSRLLKKSLTSRWLKPGSLVSDVRQAVGAPWEILRLSLDGRTIDAYSKSGDLPGYHALLVLLPDLDVGFTILQAGNESVVQDVVTVVTSGYLPAMESCARDDAVKNLVGRYEAVDQSLNSSLTIDADSGPGFVMTDILSNGSDIVNILGPEGKTETRIYPTNLGSLSDGKGQAFRIVTKQVGGTSVEPESSPTAAEVAKLLKNVEFPDLNCVTWATVDGPSYGNVGLDHVIFRRENEKTLVKWPVLRVEMERVDN
ncbi:MAG: hypothetical protein M1831_007587 [Alyxoria varia]|nr:MAG: hypothetical protein M1831_007587 [Alyxoria varia]